MRVEIFQMTEVMFMLLFGIKYFIKMQKLVIINIKRGEKHVYFIKFINSYGQKNPFYYNNRWGSRRYYNG